MTYLNNTIDKISKENKYCIIMDDFNLDLLKCDLHPPTEEFLNTLGSNFYNPHILQPTRTMQCTILLLSQTTFRFNSIAHHTISGNLIYDLSDHLPNFLVINKFSTLPKNVHIFRRDFSKFNEVIFLSDIQSIKWDKELEGHSDVNKLFETFYNKLLEIVDKHVPLNKISKKLMKQLSKPWITPGIRKLYKVYIGIRLKTNSIKNL